MAELTHLAGLQSPEIENGTGEVIVRFRPTNYIAPERVSHDLSALQRRLLQVLTKLGAVSSSEIAQKLPAGTSRRTIQSNLRLLLELGLVDRQGERRWAKWMLKGTSP
jgi:predicted HTH transcriptional regulator